MSKYEESVKLVMQYFEECTKEGANITEINEKYMIAGKNLRSHLGDISLWGHNTYPFTNDEMGMVSLAPEKVVFGTVEVEEGLLVRCKMPLRSIPKVGVKLYVPDPLSRTWVAYEQLHPYNNDALLRTIKRVGYYLNETDARIYCKLRHGVLDDESRGIKD